MLGLVALIIMAMVGIYLFRDDIKNRVVSELNARLRTEVQVDVIELEMLETFPRISIAFRDVVVAGYGVSSDTLLSAKSLFLELNSWKLIQGEYRVDRISLLEGQAGIHHWGDGSWNYEILEPRGSGSEVIDLDLERIELNAIKLIYADHIADESLSAYLHEALMYVEVGKKVEIGMDLRAEDSQYRLQKDEWAIPGLTDWKGILTVAGDTTIVENMTLRRGAFQISIDGELVAGFPELNISSRGLQLEDLRDILPAGKQEILEPYKLRGKCGFQGYIRGHDLRIDFSVENGQMKQDKLAMEIERLDLKGSLVGDSRSMASALLEIDELKLISSAGELRGSLMISDLDQPLIRSSLEGKLDLHDLFMILEDEHLQEVEGLVELSLEFENKFSGWDWTSNELRNARSSGWLRVVNGRGKVAGYEQGFELGDVELHYDNRNLLIDKLKGTAGQSQFSFVGSFQNIWEYLLLPEGKMHLDAKFSADRLMMDEWLSSAEDAEGEYELHISPRLSYQLQLDVREFRFGAFEARDISGRMIQKNGDIHISPLRFLHSGGSFTGDLRIASIGDDYLDFYSEARLKGMDIRNIFSSFDNFGQTTLRSEHIGGIGDAEVRFYGRWGTDLVADLSSVKVWSSVRIRGGELKGFEPLEYLSDYVEISDLRHVKFSELSNTIEIHDQRIYIPEMEVHSSALDFGASGDHGFDNQINYLIRLELTDVMFREKRLENPDMDEYVVVEDDGLAPNLYLRMTGDVYHPQIRYDMKAAGRDVARDWQSEKEEIKDAWRSTFSRDSTDETKDEGPRYELEWDDSST